MIKLDKIDILCPYNPNTMNVNDFSTTSHTAGEIINSVYPVEKKYKNDMGISFNRYALNQRDGELKVSINSHLLGKRYPEKINIENIEDCLRTVLDRTSTNIFNPNELIEKGYTNHIHATEDVEMTLDKTDYKAIDSLLRKPMQWVKDDTSRNSYGWRSKLAGAPGKKMLKMYGKEAQMSRKPRREFLRTYGIPLSVFHGITRIELKLHSPETIRKGFDSDNNKVLSILSSKKNPIVKFLNTNFDLHDTQRRWLSIEKIGDLEKICLMEKYENDWNTIEGVIRKMTKTNASKMIKKYRDLYQEFVEAPDIRSRGAGLLTSMIDLIKLDEEDILQRAA